ncbi:hypothetical protein [Gaoshiqia sediminis]|uniref:Uncharacterized protein n=1 Tax=Gaoshiqia sediminis TaxID=2986998 RepID=A0AA41YCU2_9BACT|nr:hypothetical protein [Gaoshiqia sediminis]MCW0484090.1 hypothetical protein [Gaoshiqia sediminis]
MKKINTMFNIFQGNDLIKKTIASVLGYDNPENSWFTKDMYFEAFFYLSKRFGSPSLFDEYKEAGAWSFNVKDYVIEIRMNSSWVQFMMYGKISNHEIHSPYAVKYRRIRREKRDKILSELGDWNDKEEELAGKLFDDFLKENDIDASISQDQFDKEYRGKWFEYVCLHNKRVINLDYDEFTGKYGKIYQNSYTRHAQKTLTQFLKNMLTPIWVRDCPYNIKGRLSDEEAAFYSRYRDNIKIEFKK